MHLEEGTVKMASEVILGAELRIGTNVHTFELGRSGLQIQLSSRNALACCQQSED